MNLTKLFNKNYLLENMKKSKGALILFLILVPIMSGIMLMSLNSDSNTLHVLDHAQMSAINIMGMYGIPVVLSIILFGYVYKKASVDFINSMPINRKSIFITNTIGGIALILIMQIITLVEILICGMLFNSIVIFPQVIFESFIILTIAYIFVFTATNIAMSLSGNALTQIAVTALILFLVPFCHTLCRGEFSQNNYLSVYSTYGMRLIETTKDVNYTMPYKMFSDALYGSSFYSATSIVKMTLLSIVYIILGNYLFQKRKMENTEESFSNKYMHLIIKGLTLIPMVVFINAIRGGIFVLAFPLALTIIYYFVYDLITRKKIKFLHSVAGLIITAVILQIAYMGVEKLNENRNLDYMNKDEVSQISIDLKSEGYYYSRRDLDKPILNYYMDNRELIDIIFENGYEFNDRNYKEYVVEDKIGIDYEDIEQIERERVYSVQVNFKMNNGKTSKMGVSLPSSSMDQIIKILSKDSNYVDSIRDVNLDNYIIKISRYIMDIDNANEIKNEIKNELNKMSLFDYKEKIIDNSSEVIALFGFRNHEVVRLEMPVNLNEKIFKIITTSFNKKTIEDLETLKNSGRYYNFNINGLEKYLDRDKEYIYWERIHLSENEINRFIMENANVECNINKDFVAIWGYPGEMRFFTNKIDELIKILEKIDVPNYAEPEPYYKAIY